MRLDQIGKVGAERGIKVGARRVTINTDTHHPRRRHAWFAAILDHAEVVTESLQL